MTEPFERPAAQPGDRELAVYLHENACEDDSCGGWERVSSFGKAGWLDLAREVIARVKVSRTARVVELANEAFATAADGIRGGVPDAGREQCAREWAAQQVGYYARSWFNNEVTALSEPPHD